MRDPELYTDDIEQTEFTYDELSGRAQDKVRERYRKHALDCGWWDAVYEDAVTIGALIGIEIGQRQYISVKRKTCYQTDISFSGFCSQGDGCSYSGWLNIDELQACTARLRAHVGSECKDTTLFALAAQGEALYAILTARLVALRMAGDWDGESDVPDGEFSLTDSPAIVGDGHRSFTTRVRPDSCAEELEEQMNAYVSGFADWIYKQLEAEHDHLTSNETIDETVRAQEEKYDESGSTL